MNTKNTPSMPSNPLDRETLIAAFKAGFDYAMNGTDRYGDYNGGTVEDGFAEFIAALAPLPSSEPGPVVGWQPISTAPKDGTRILVTPAVWEPQRVATAFYCGGLWWVTGPSDGDYKRAFTDPDEDPTHWPFTHWTSAPPSADAQPPAPVGPTATDVLRRLITAWDADDFPTFNQSREDARRLLEAQPPAPVGPEWKPYTAYPVGPKASAEQGIVTGCLDPTAPSFDIVRVKNAPPPAPVGPTTPVADFEQSCAYCAKPMAACVCQPSPGPTPGVEPLVFLSHHKLCPQRYCDEPGAPSCKCPKGWPRKRDTP